MMRAPSAAELRRTLWNRVGQLPRGHITTYGALAEALGSPAAARWVGQQLAQHTDCPGTCCHRVVRHNGELGSFAHGPPQTKARLLAEEGHTLRRLGRVSETRWTLVGPPPVWSSFRGSQPLAPLRAAQETLAEQVRIESFGRAPALVGGLDVSYARDRAVGAYVLYERKRGRVAWQVTLEQRAGFPYIPGFLSFRELPLLTALVDRARKHGCLAEVLLVDGSGVLHPRRFGLAAHLGVLCDWPTVGLTKHLLCGRLVAGAKAAVQPIEFDNELLGARLSRPGFSRPCYVSPGHRVDLALAIGLVQACWGSHRLPEPIYWADRLSRSSAHAARGGNAMRRGKRAAAPAMVKS